MRVDKFLWAVRVFKHGPWPASIAVRAKCLSMERRLKPAREVKVGEVVDVRKGAVTFGHEVVSFPRSRVGAALVPDHMRRHVARGKGKV